MDKLVSPKIVALTFGILTISFLTAFYVVAWQEPSQAPPEGNIATPFNVSTNPQAKPGRISATEFYDYNDPSYYANPTGESHFYSLCLAGECITNWSEVQPVSCIGTPTDDGCAIIDWALDTTIEDSISISWTGDDGLASSAETIKHAYGGQGTFWAYVTVVDSNNVPWSASCSVELTQGPCEIILATCSIPAYWTEVKYYTSGATYGACSNDCHEYVQGGASPYVKQYGYSGIVMYCNNWMTDFYPTCQGSGYGECANFGVMSLMDCVCQF